MGVLLWRLRSEPDPGVARPVLLGLIALSCAGAIAGGYSLAHEDSYGSTFKANVGAGAIAVCSGSLLVTVAALFDSAGAARAQNVSVAPLANGLALLGKF